MTFAFGGYMKVWRASFELAFDSKEFCWAKGSHTCNQYAHVYKICLLGFKMEFEWTREQEEVTE